MSLSVEYNFNRVDQASLQMRAKAYSLPPRAASTPAQKLASGTMGTEIRHPEWLNRAVYTATVQWDPISAVSTMCGSLTTLYDFGYDDLLDALRNDAETRHNRTTW
jgi:hypothetical protein